MSPTAPARAPARPAPRAALLRDRARLDDLVLAALAGEERDGHDVRALLERQLGAARGVSPSTVFHTLHRLARNRLVTRSSTDARRYRLTATGRRSLDARTAAARAFADAVEALQR